RASPRDRRDATRHLLRVPARVLIDEGRWTTDAQILDLSIGGARLAVPLPLPTADGLQIEFDPRTVAQESRSMMLRGLVRWRRPDVLGFAYGLSFEDLEPEDENELRRLAPPMDAD